MVLASVGLSQQLEMSGADLYANEGVPKVGLTVKNVRLATGRGTQPLLRMPMYPSGR